jgi:hypothetical protein
MLTWAQATAMMHQEYLPMIEDHIVLEDFVTKYITKNNQIETENVGTAFRKEYRYSFSEGTGMMTDATSALSNPGRTLYKYFNGTTKLRNGVCKIYSAIAKLMKNNDKAFVNELTAETEGLAEAMKAEQERMICGDAGYTALLQLNASTGVTDASPSVCTCATGYTTKRLRPGMKIEIKDHAEGAITNGTNIEVQDIVSDTVFLADLVVTGGTRTTLVAAINAGTTNTATVWHNEGYQKEFYGFESLFNSISNTVLGVDRNANAGAWFRPQVWKATASGVARGVRTGTNADWELSDISAVVSDLTQRRKAKKADLVIFCSEGVRQYGTILKQALGEANVAATKIDWWPYDDVTFNGIRVVSPPAVWDNTMYIQSMPDWVKFEAIKLGWDDMDGDMFKWVSGYAAYEAYMLEMLEMGHYRPWRCATMNDMAGSF